MTTTKIRSGLYQVGQYMIEDYETPQGWVWRVTDTENYSDPWVGDYATKRQAVAEISALMGR
jgi:hypothetical protein